MDIDTDILAQNELGYLIRYDVLFFGQGFV